MRNTNLIRSLFALLFFPAACFSQVSLTGPTCVMAGLVYQYNISSSLDSATGMKFCISGGKFSDAVDACITLAPQSFIHVIWNGNFPAGNIALTNSDGNSSISVQIAEPLRPGTIDSALAFQIIDTLDTPQNLICTPAAEGHCSPAYTYQWESSPDFLIWTPVTGATSVNLLFNGPISTSLYYRRRVMETHSNTLAYSNVSTIFLR